jgi:transposase-like protein
MTKSTRKSYSAEFKARVALEALHGLKTINEIAQDHGVHPVQIGQWKKEVQNQAISLFSKKRGKKKKVTGHESPEHLYSEIGRLKVELDWLKKKSEGYL